MSEIKTVYLAGGKSDWRKKIIKRWEKLGVDGYDPFERSGQGSIAEFTYFDLNAIARSDLVFAYCDYHKYTGMALEFGYAYSRNIPIIFVVGPGMPRIDSMMIGVSKVAFTDLDEAVKFVEERYLTDQS